MSNLEIVVVYKSQNKALAIALSFLDNVAETLFYECPQASNSAWQISPTDFLGINKISLETSS